jgi:hypothetical protein
MFNSAKVVSALPPQQDKKNEIRSDSHVIPNVEDAIKNYCNNAYLLRYGQMRDVLNEYEMFWKMRASEYVAEGDDSPFKKWNLPVLAGINEMLEAQIEAQVLPDKQRYDFFRFIPETQTWDDAADPITERILELAEMGVASDLARCYFAHIFKQSLPDLTTLGNMMALECWERTVTHREMEVDNPAYDQSLPPEFNVAIDDQGRSQFIPPKILKMQPDISFDAPRVRYLNPMNVFPSDLFKNNICECDSVCIYDTCTLDELEEDKIYDDEKTGLKLGIYANLDQIGVAEATTNVPEVKPNASGTFGMSNSSDSARGASPVDKKLERVTFIGKLSPYDVFGTRYPDTGDMQEFYDKFNIDPDRALHKIAWIVEIINGKTMVRCQPVPYNLETVRNPLGLPIIHHKLYSIPNRTLGHGNYKRCQYDERFYNFFSRMEIEYTTKVVDPPIGIVLQAFDQKQLQIRGGRYVFRRGDALVMKDNSIKLQDAMQRYDFPSMPLQAIQQQKSVRQSAMDSKCHMPVVRQGMASGSDTATEAQAINSNANVMISWMSDWVEAGYFQPIVEGMYMLRKQYERTNRLITIPDASGQPNTQLVAPDVWQHQLKCWIVTERKATNQAAELMNIMEFYKLVMNDVDTNKAEFKLRIAKKLNISNPGKLTLPNPPTPPPPVKESVTYAFKANELPIEVQAQILKRDNFEVGPQVLMALLATALQQQQQEQQQGAEPGAQAAPANGNGNGGEYSNGSHHKQGEVEMRQRGLHDSQGVQRTLAQKTRDPANMRRNQP